MKPKIVFEVEWMANADIDNPEFEFMDFPTLRRARNYAAHLVETSPTGVAQIREIRVGREFPSQRELVGDMEEVAS